MRNVALEFTNGLLNKNFDGCSEDCKALLSIQQEPKFSIPYSKINVVIENLPLVYKGKVSIFLNHYDYLSKVNIGEKEYEMINVLLSNCSQQEAIVFSGLLLLKPEPRTFNFKEFHVELSKVYVQEIPKNASRLVLEFNKQGIKELRGTLNRNLEQAVSKYFKGYEGTVDFLQTPKKLFIHDLWGTEKSTERLLKLSRFTDINYIAVMTPYYFEHTKYIDYFLKNTPVLIKPSVGLYTEVYKKG
jgi:hypothetical protein